MKIKTRAGICISIRNSEILITALTIFCVMKQKTFSITVLVLAILVVSIAVTLWLSELYVEKHPGYEDRGYPIPWKRIYGGVDIRHDYRAFVFDILFWFAVFSVIVVVGIFVFVRIKR